MNRTLAILAIAIVAAVSLVAWLALGSSGSSHESTKTTADAPGGGVGPNGVAGAGEVAQAAGAGTNDASRAKVDRPSNTGNAAIPGRVGILQGRILASDTNTPVAGAKIFLDRAGRGFFRMVDRSQPAPEPAGVSAADGSFKLVNVPAGRTQELKVEAPGRRRLTTPVSVLSKGETRVLGDLYMDLGAAAEGRVTDPAGAPIANASVMARRGGQQGPGGFTMGGFPLEIEVTTDSSGRYKLDGLPPEEPLTASAVADARISASSPAFVPKIGSPVQIGDIVLREGKEVTGKVVDRGGAAVAQASVRLGRQGGGPGADFMLDGRSQGNITTDADGRFRIRGLDDRPLRIDVTATGKGSAQKRNVTPGTRDLVFELDPYGAVRGKVVAAPGVDPKSLDGALETFLVHASSTSDPGVRFFFMNAERQGEGKAIGGGKFEIFGLAKGKYRIEVSGDGFAPAVSDVIEVSAERPVEDLEIAVHPGRALAVKVHRTGSQEPVQGARVRVHEKRGDGDFPFPMMQNDEEDDGGASPAFAAPPMRGAATARRVEMSVRSGDLGGARGGPGRAFPGSSSSEEDNRPQAYDKTVETDAQGIARFVGLPDATFEVLARKLDFAPSEPLEVEVVAPEAGKPAPEVALAMGEGGTLEGRVLRGGATPAVGASVELTGPEPTNAKKTAWVDGLGHYRFEHARPGVYHAEVKTQPWMGGGMNFVIANGNDAPTGVAATVQEGKVTALDLDAPILATLTGVVTQAGSPVAGVRVAISPMREGEFDMPMGIDFGGSKSATTNSEGRYKIENVELGKYRVRAQRNNAPRPLITETTVANEKEKFDLQLPRGVIEGRVVRGDNHEGIANANVSLITVSDPNVQSDVMMVTMSSSGGGGDIVTWDGRSSVRTDKDGRFKLEDVPAGAYRVRAQASGYRDGRTDKVELAADARLGDVEVKLEKAASLTGRVLGPGGAPRNNALVTLSRASGEPVSGRAGIKMTDAEGRYKFDSLDPGDYTVSARVFGAGVMEIGGPNNKGVPVTLAAGQETTKDISVEQ